ncbi:hypothetical protein GmHk_09G026969 [Glycine max]|nr:hypothetical protein GmHk_09G026969 [Glycine max]
MPPSPPPPTTTPLTESPHRTPSSTSNSSTNFLNVTTRRSRPRSANRRRRSSSTFSPSLPPSSTSSTSSPRFVLVLDSRCWAFKSVHVLDSCSWSDLVVLWWGWVCDGGGKGPNRCCCGYAGKDKASHGLISWRRCKGRVGCGAPNY